MTKLEHGEEAIEATELHLRRMISLIPCNDMGEWVVTLKNWDAINKALNAAMKLARLTHARSRPEPGGEFDREQVEAAFFKDKPAFCMKGCVYSFVEGARYMFDRITSSRGNE